MDWYSCFHHHASSVALLYLLLFAASVGENLFPPLPGDMIMLLGAFFAGQDILSLWGVTLVTVAGSLSGYMLLYWIGSRLGHRVHHKMSGTPFRSGHIRSAGRYITRYGYPVVLVNRFFPVIRSVISLASGVYELEAKKVFVCALISVIGWNGVWIGGGYSLGHNWELLQERAEQIMFRYTLFVAVLCLLVAAAFLLYRLCLKGLHTNE